MSIVDGCVLLVCSGANERVRPLADWTDEPARRVVCRAVVAGACGTERPVRSRS